MMKDLTATTSTMSSRDLLELVNNARLQHGEKVIRANDFISRIQDELEGDHYESFVVQNSNNTESTVFKLTEDQCMLVSMRGSKAVRRTVLGKLKTLTASSAPVLPRTPTDLALNHITAVMQLATLFEVPIHLAQVEAVKGARLTYHIDFTEMLRLAPAQGMIRLEDEAVEPTELGKRLGLTAVKMNQWLEERGFQAKINSEWVPTDKGKPFAVRHQWVVGNKSGYNYKWKKSVLNA
jgi:hypothetical protein